MKCFVFYRMPYAETYVEIEQLDGQPETFQSPLELDGHNGFVVAPFSSSDTEPLILIRPDKMTTADVPPVEGEPGGGSCLDTDEAVRDRQRMDYSIDFANYHSRLECGDFQKIVLARSTELPRKGDVDLKKLFFKACHGAFRIDTYNTVIAPVNKPDRAVLAIAVSSTGRNYLVAYGAFAKVFQSIVTGHEAVEGVRVFFQVAIQELTGYILGNAFNMSIIFGHAICRRVGFAG